MQIGVDIGGIFTDIVALDEAVPRRPRAAFMLTTRMPEPLDRHATAMGGTSREPRRLRAEERGAHRRVDAVGPDHHVGEDGFALGGPELHRAGVLPHGHEAAAQAGHVGGQRAREEAEEIRSVEVVVRRAEARLDRVAERLAPQDGGLLVHAHAQADPRQGQGGGQAPDARADHRRIQGRRHGLTDGGRRGVRMAA
jgi:hypothetical protein